MNSMFSYLLEANAILLVGVAVYALLLRTTTFFNQKRYFLLGLMGISLLLPLIPTSIETVAPVLSAQLPEFTVSTAMTNGTLSPDLNLVLLIVYAVGAMFFASMLLIAAGFTINRISRGERSRIGSAVLIRDKDADQPSSFLNFIFWPSNYSLEQDREVLRHELAHVNQGHSYDIILGRVFLALNWFNPLAHWLMKELETQHELLADEAATGGEDISVEHYSRLLLSQALDPKRMHIAHTFFNRKTIKQRIMMLNKQKSKSTERWKTPTAILLALMLATGIACTKTDEAENVEKSDVLTVVDEMPEYPGGQEAFMDFMINEVKYPESAKKDNLEGTVYVEFVVDKEGKISDIAPKNESDERLEEAAIAAVKTMPDWTPGVHEGERVNVKMVLPIRFQLPKE